MSIGLQQSDWRKMLLTTVKVVTFLDTIHLDTAIFFAKGLVENTVGHPWEYYVAIKNDDVEADSRARMCYMLLYEGAGRKSVRTVWSYVHRL